MSTCCLCSNLVSPGPDEFWNKPLFESPSFVVVPSLGSLVEGWLLVVPKIHCISMGALSPSLANEMEQLKADLIAAVHPRYGRLCVFEHSPSRVGRRIGCGVDHAHLHVVPLNFDLMDAVTPFMPDGAKWLPATGDTCRNAFENNQDYLYLEQPLGSGYIATHEDFGSQIFRRAIASHLGISEQFNWRDYPQKEAVARTIHRLSAPVYTAADAG
jgi:ATP adenylyltransferase